MRDRGRFGRGPVLLAQWDGPMRPRKSRHGVRLTIDDPSFSPLPDRSRSMSSHEVSQFTRRTIWAVFVVCAGACGRDATSPSLRAVQVFGAVSAKAKAPAAPGVSSTQPSFGDQGTT